MRIGIDLQACQSSCSRDRGIGRYAIALARAMIDAGRPHAFEVLLNGAFPETLEPVRRALSDLRGHWGVRDLSLPVQVAEQAAPDRARARAAEFLREALVAESKLDVVHVSSLFEGWVDDAVTSIGALGAGPATAVTLYDLIPLLRQETYLANPANLAWYARKVDSLRRAGMILAISEATRRDAIDRLGIPGNRVRMIGGAADAIFRPLVVESHARVALGLRYGITKPCVLYTGGIDRRKNVDGLIEAYGLLPPLIRDAHQLVIVCAVSDADRRDLADVVMRARLPPEAVVLTGYVPDQDLVALYNVCELFVFPPLLEGFGLPALEAMACGAAVIGSATSSIPEVIGRDDALFDPRQPESIAAAIAKALTDRSFIASLRAHSSVQASRFTWPAVAARALDALEELHARRSDRTGLIPPGMVEPVAALEPLDAAADPRAALDATHNLAMDLGRRLESIDADMRGIEMLSASQSAAEADTRAAWAALIASLHDERATHAETRGRLQDEAADHRATRSQLDAGLAELSIERARRVQLEGRLAFLEQGLAGLQSSRSWRITAPLRATMQFARRLRGGGRLEHSTRGAQQAPVAGRATLPMVTRLESLVMRDLERITTKRQR